MLPENIALFVREEEPKAEVIEELLKTQPDLKTCLARLGKVYKLKVWFKEPVRIQVPKRWVQTAENTRMYKTAHTADCHVFNYICRDRSESSLLYAPARGARTGYFFPNLNLVTKYEIVDKGIKKENFDSYEEFKKKFDPFFITEDQIKSLWNSKSAQHGGKYCPADFHKIGKRGREVLKRFLTNFKGIDNGGGEGYSKSPHGDYTVLSQRYYSYHHTGRDISISHQTNIGIVHYSSEYHGCGNGRYGIVANRSEFLWLEDD